MVSRRYLRTKVMQAIFAYELNDVETIPSSEKKLIESIESCYTLFLYFFSLFVELKRYRTNKLEDIKNKINPTEEDLHPNTKFIDNKVICQIEDNVYLKKLWRDYHILWTNENDFIAQIYQELIVLPEYNTYMSSTSSSYNQDKELIIKIIENTFYQSQLLHWYFEEKNVYWFDDYDAALFMLRQNVQSFKENQGIECPIHPLIKDDEDRQFYMDLFRKTLLNSKEYGLIIEKKLENWEAERVMGIDMILMKMAVCELLEFPTIPVKVSINEYIEIAKDYSSVKSKSFINGLLDKIITELREEGQMVKYGRGLITESTPRDK